VVRDRPPVNQGAAHVPTRNSLPASARCAGPLPARRLRPIGAGAPGGDRQGPLQGPAAGWGDDRFLPPGRSGKQVGGSHPERRVPDPARQGLFPGRYRVRIIAGDGTSGGGKAEPSGPRPGATPGKERIPPEYNAKSEIIKEVKPDEPNRFDFTIR